MYETTDIAKFDRLIHEPSRLAILSVLWACEKADFTYLLNVTGLSKGNLSAQLRKLEEIEYITITKSFKGRYPNTSAALTSAGRKAFSSYQKKYLALAKYFQK